MSNKEILERYEDRMAISPADGEDREDHGCFDCISRECNLCHQTGKYVTDNSPACHYWEEEK